MPVKSCSKDGKPGFKWGDSGACYPYTAGDDASKEAARKKAIAQGAAMKLADAGIPSSCVCPKCGYKLANPTKHCPELGCPKCGESMRKQMPGTGGGQGKGGPTLSIQMQEIIEKNIPLAICSVCLHEAHSFVDGADPLTLPCPVCNGVMEEPEGFSYTPTTYEALKLHYRPWTEGVKKEGI